MYICPIGVNFRKFRYFVIITVNRKLGIAVFDYFRYFITVSVNRKLGMAIFDYFRNYKTSVKERRS